jgi:EAL domain-containing protein (putative c-di-GMP-specific phosphodiesterase class I)
METVTKADLPPNAICIEVTESALMDEGAVRELHNLRKAGFQVAVDDFGTGYSSLSYLQRLPVDGTKIDQAFVHPSGSDERANRFLASIVTLVHTLGLQAIAEGCETEEQWEAICAADCDRAQGWLVSKARPPSEIDELLVQDI